MNTRGKYAPAIQYQPLCRSTGFTLVELLVVIGIIALLISILLPALNRARQAAQRTACAARLQQIMIAANLHRTEHRDYYPLAGVLTGAQPQELDDNDTIHYDYLPAAVGGYVAPVGMSSVLAPINISLATEMGYKWLLTQSAAQQVTNLNDPTGFSRSFLCPSQADNALELQTLESWNPALYITMYPGPPASSAYNYIQRGAISYVFNEFVLGFSDKYGRLRGHATQVHQPSRTFFACDGIGDDGFSLVRAETKSLPSPVPGLYTIYNSNPISSPNQLNGGVITLGDIISNNGLGGTAMCFDARRHQKKMNIAFCDGHVETRNVTANDLQGVFLLPP
jgi:prepilin-type processing-associated H-X9-DG protein/prepilin-type N-terminal cleavage/methylation domain-containing protein